ncbi:MAG: hypothetical protein HOA08_21290 [Rhodospirillaceae bacterium]|jgi:hypothetical protein|nr:hypothetical protein [Rhodospirillaceae bacterium]MBT3491114.1 hypothetical protein [Rhodospirillaceae bacterium]MBT3781852.1 hypothetical protein [Rhodospirillaceae bacterium]MBT3975345.1 hypothetical protein [Rhodospirillaceae bacterium]MBT4170050.1 hypothetical protein [Rhodospirillaceae bacterium]
MNMNSFWLDILVVAHQGALHTTTILVNILHGARWEGNAPRTISCADFLARLALGAFSRKIPSAQFSIRRTDAAALKYRTFRGRL